MSKTGLFQKEKEEEEETPGLRPKHRPRPLSGLQRVGALGTGAAIGLTAKGIADGANTAINNAQQASLNRGLGTHRQFFDILNDSPEEVMDIRSHPNREFAALSEYKAKRYGLPKGMVFVDTVTPHIGLTAHEVGHTKQHKGALGHLTRAADNMYSVSKGATHASALPSIGLGLSKNKNLRRLGVALPWLAAAPMLVEEGRANVHAWKILNQVASGAEKSEARKSLARSFGSYLSVPAAMSAGSYAAGKASQYARRKMEEDNEEDARRAERRARRKALI